MYPPQHCCYNLSTLKRVQQELSGWGGVLRSRSWVLRPEHLSDVSLCLDSTGGAPLIGRGLGRSYGDAALNGGGAVVLTDRIDRMLRFDEESGVLSCEAGISLEEIIGTFLPRGWFLPVTPGTKFVTLGGAVACDVHGKNHHGEGSLSKYLLDLELLTAQGEKVRCSPQREQDLFWATVGGMGLTGIILSATLKLRRVETGYVRVRYEAASSLEEVMDLMESRDDSYTYSVAWVDGMASGAALGRSILMHGNHALLSELSEEQKESPLRPGPRRCFTVPFSPPQFFLNRYSVGVFNGLYYRIQQGKGEVLVDYDRFFYPLDSLASWNRLYGRRGFFQYQCVFPAEVSRQAVTEILRRLGAEGVPMFLVVLKRFGPAAGLLSFPMPGYTLALDVPMQGQALLETLRGLDRWVISKGGRVYLAKDASTSGDSFRAMYPGLDEWLRVKRNVDPQDRFSSDLSRRLGISSRAGS